VFYKYRKKNEAASWVVLEIDPSVLWESDCLFNKSNAADREQSSTSQKIRRLPSSFHEMFLDSFRGVNRNVLNIPDNYPTYPQAEILVIGSIPLIKIRSAIFENTRSANLAQSIHGSILNRVSVKIDPSIYGRRSDADHWVGRGVNYMVDQYSVDGIVPRPDSDEIPF
jgi:hypothetical protein